MSAAEAKRVVVIDDDRLLTEALALAWEREDDLAIVGVADTGAKGVDLAFRARPDVVLVDQHLPDLSGAEATAALRAALPEIPVVIMTIDPTDEAMLAAIEAGASGFLAKADGIRSLAAAVRQAANGEMLIGAPTVARLLALTRDRERLRAGQVVPVEALTVRETEVLQLMAQGLDTRGLAERLVLSQTTVRTHVAAILSKLDAHSRLEAVVKASELGLLG
jgi:DNA-binding NarL/FixJ family response regulator